MRFTFTAETSCKADLIDLLRASVGISSSKGVEVTARQQAYKRCFNVTLATDTMTDMQTDYP